ncbi:MAG: pre-peptidase C-terminal domain-containing protein, partial [candidate division WOR-3 bacterium]
QAWAVDDATRRQSNILSFEVTRTIEGFTATTIGQSVSFFHNGTDPTPSFIFCGRAGDVISFRLVGTIETGFVLTNEAGGVLASGSTFGSFLRFDGPLLTSGNFKILAFRNNCCSSVGTYGFNLQRVSNPNFAVAIACGGRGAGLVSTIGDRRTFTFDGAAGDKITITMSRGSSGNVQPLIEVYDANGNLIADAAATSGGTTATISNLTLSRSGRFSILASDTATQVGSYTLSLQCQR